MSDSQKLYKKKHFSCNRGSPDPNLFRSEHVRLNGEEKEKPVDLADEQKKYESCHANYRQMYRVYIYA